MPVRYRTKQYFPQKYYHIYNKGLDGRDVFLDDEDFQTMLKLLARYLSPFSISVDTRYKKKPSELRRERELNLEPYIYMVAFCLLSNHFHFLVYQKSADAITQLMRRVMTGYVMYFNVKYRRNGPLFETNYRAVVVEGEEQALYMTRYIHLNPVTRTVRRFGPVETVSASRPDDYLYSSYSHYIGIKNINWIKPLFIEHTEVSYQKWINEGSVSVPDFLKDIKID